MCCRSFLRWLIFDAVRVEFYSVQIAQLVLIFILLAEIADCFCYFADICEDFI